MTRLEILLSEQQLLASEIAREKRFIEREAAHSKARARVRRIDLIYSAVKSGKRRAEVAREFGLSASRVHELFHKGRRRAEVAEEK
jgi:hypothetical protein